LTPQGAVRIGFADVANQEIGQSLVEQMTISV